MNYEIDVEKLMEYADIGEFEITCLNEKLEKDTSFRLKCKKHIRDKGVQSKMGFIISKLLGEYSVHSDDMDRYYEELGNDFFCINHSKSIYMKFADFHSIGNLSKLQLYYFYLFNKTEYNKDIDDIHLMFNEIDEIKYIKISRNPNIYEESHNINMGFYNQNISKDSYNNISKDSYNNISKDSYNNISKDSYNQNISKDSYNNISKDSYNNILKDSYNQNISKDSYNNISKDSYNQNISKDSYNQNISKDSYNLNISKDSYNLNISGKQNNSNIKENSIFLNIEKKQYENLNYHTDIQIYRQIFNILVNRKANIRFHKSAFEFIKELDPSENLRSLICKYIREIIYYKLDVGKNYEYIYEDMKKVLEYLERNGYLLKRNSETDNIYFFVNEFSVFISKKSRKLKNKLECDDKHKSNLDIYQQKITEKHSYIVPLISFNDFEWLTDDVKNILLMRYVDLYNINSCVENFVSTDKCNLLVRDFFYLNYHKIINSVMKGLTMCKLDIEIRPKDFSLDVLKKICIKSNFSYSLRKIFLYKKMPEVFCKNFLSKINHVQAEELKEIILIDTVDENFILTYIDFIIESYDFIYLIEIFTKLIKNYSRKVIIKIQKYIINSINEIYFLETYLEHIISLYKDMLGVNDKLVHKYNEEILDLVIIAAKKLGKSVLIGNIKGI